jgi:uncharacterized protein (TIGR03083 family)
MATAMTVDQHLAALAASGAALRGCAEVAGLNTPVPTCPAWTVRDLVSHQGTVHRWAAANLRGDKAHRTSDSQAAARAAADLLGWYSDGLAALLETVADTADDVTAMVFLADAPPPRRFWARRQAHETTIHRVDALAAQLGRRPVAADVELDPVLAVDGIDELLTGFVPRGTDRLTAVEPYTLLVRADDTGDAWTLRISDGPVVTTREAVDAPAAVFSGTAVGLYLSLWNRADDLTVTGRPDVLDGWRTNIRIRWR